MTLRIVIWNCGMALHKKAEPLMALNPDIAIIVINSGSTLELIQLC